MDGVKGTACAWQLCDLLPVVHAFKQIGVTAEKWEVVV